MGASETFRKTILRNLIKTARLPVAIMYDCHRAYFLISSCRPDFQSTGVLIFTGHEYHLSISLRNIHENENRHDINNLKARCNINGHRL